MPLIYHPDRSDLERFLGPTESELMSYLWECSKGRTLTQIYYYRANGRAKTTVQTILNKLVRKGLLTRTKNGTEHFVYAPAEPRAQWEARQLEAVQKSLE